MSSSFLNVNGAIGKIYISGAVTGVENYLEIFNTVETDLMEQGYDVINPVRVMDALPKSTTYEQYMEMSMVMITMADTVFMLNGWENSKGACVEHNYAIEHNLNIIYQKRCD